MKSIVTYSDETKTYIKQVKSQLKAKYGKLEDSWDLTLNLLADTYEMYNMCWDVIKTHGVYKENTGLKSPVLSTLKDCTATILKLQQQLGITPWAESKIKTTENDDTDDFLENLTK